MIVLWVPKSLIGKLIYKVFFPIHVLYRRFSVNSSYHFLKMYLTNSETNTLIIDVGTGSVGTKKYNLISN